MRRRKGELDIGTKNILYICFYVSIKLLSFQFFSISMNIYSMLLFVICITFRIKVKRVHPIEIGKKTSRKNEEQPHKIYGSKNYCASSKMGLVLGSGS